MCEDLFCIMVLCILWIIIYIIPVSKKRKKEYVEVSDIRNKLTPLKNMVKLIEMGQFDIVVDQLSEARKSINYLSKKEEFEDE